MKHRIRLPGRRFFGSLTEQSPRLPRFSLTVYGLVAFFAYFFRCFIASLPLSDYFANSWGQIHSTLLQTFRYSKMKTTLFAYVYLYPDCIIKTGTRRDQVLIQGVSCLGSTRRLKALARVGKRARDPKVGRIGADICSSLPPSARMFAGRVP